VLVHGGDVDDPTAVPGLDHPPRCPLGTQERPREIGVYNLPPLLVGELQELARLQSEQSSSRVPSESSLSQSSPAFLLPWPAVLVVWTGVMHFPRELPLLEVRVGLGVVALCLLVQRDHLPGSLGGRREVCGHAREDEHIGGIPRPDG
jgi:hypothetical protein